MNLMNNTTIDMINASLYTFKNDWFTGNMTFTNNQTISNLECADRCISHVLGNLSGEMMQYIEISLGLLLAVFMIYSMMNPLFHDGGWDRKRCVIWFCLLFANCVNIIALLSIFIF